MIEKIGFLMNTTECTITYENLFKLIEQEENINFIENQEYFQSTKIEILNEHGHWTNIKGMIKKVSDTLRIKLGEAEILGAKTHLLKTHINQIKHLCDLNVGDCVLDGFGNSHTIDGIRESGIQNVYDVEVESDSHLYQCASGFIHHNTLLTAAIIEYANRLNMKTITIVPSSSLLKQTHDYIKQFEIPIGMFGAGKKDDAKNIVATWQTLQNNKSFIKDFECIIWDEVHGAKAYVSQQIMQQAVNSFIRVGLTGTIPKDPLDKANLTAGFGPVTYDVKAHHLQERNILSSIHINIFELVYPKEYMYCFVDWHDETVFLQNNEMYHTFITTIMGTLEGNTLILMKNIEPAEDLSQILGCTYISSKLSLEKRQEKFNEFVYGGNHIAVGTYSLLSTGIDIVHINNMILAPTPGKSYTKVIQSLGRGLRRKEGQKEHVNVIDLTSNLKSDKKHVKSRKDFYKEAKYPFSVDKIDVGQFKLNNSKI